MIHVLELFISGLLSLGAAALIPIGFFLWLIWTFAKILFKPGSKKLKSITSDKQTRKSLNEDLVKLGIDPKEFNKKSADERMEFWRNISDEELKAHGISTDFDLR